MIPRHSPASPKSSHEPMNPPTRPAPQHTTHLHQDASCAQHGPAPVLQLSLHIPLQLLLVLAQVQGVEAIVCRAGGQGEGSAQTAGLAVGAGGREGQRSKPAGFNAPITAPPPCHLSHCMHVSPLPAHTTAQPTHFRPGRCGPSGGRAPRRWGPSRRRRAPPRWSGGRAATGEGNRGAAVSRGRRPRAWEGRCCRPARASQLPVPGTPCANCRAGRRLPAITGAFLHKASPYGAEQRQKSQTSPWPRRRGAQRRQQRCT